MKRTRLDDRTANRILSGAVTSEDAPPGYAGVANLLHSAANEPTAGELTREAATVASMRAAILGHPVPLTASRRRDVLKKVLTAKAAAAAAVVLLGASGAAAATGSLPDSAQSTAHSVLSALSISVPGPNSHASTNVSTNDETTTTTSTSTTSTSTTVAANDVTTTTVKGPDANADFGLCTAAEAHQDNGAQPHSTVFPKPDSTTCTSVIAAHNASKGSESSDTASNSADTTSTTSTTVSGRDHGSSEDGATNSDGADSTGTTASGSHS